MKIFPDKETELALFIEVYLVHRYLGRNPFGHSALDIKALYMGLTGAAWQDTHLAAMAERYQLDLELTHNALQDAIDQAQVFRRVLNEARARSVAIPIRRPRPPKTSK